MQTALNNDPARDLPEQSSETTGTVRLHDALRDQVISSFSSHAPPRGLSMESATGLRLGESPWSIRPDAFITLDNGASTTSLFIEVDRSTERLEIVVRKCLAYSRLHSAGGFARYCGLPRSEARRCPFRVLFYVKSLARAENISRALRERAPQIRSLIWFSSEPASMDPFTIEWRHAGDHARGPKLSKLLS